MSQDSRTNSKICGICNEKESKYCCPKCEVLYCSLECYRSKDHVKCSETFYRDCVNEELTFHNADDESKKKMMDILQRMQGEDIDDSTIEELLETIETNGTVDSDDEEGIDLHERVKNLNLDDPDQLWSALTEDERNEFKAMLDQGDVGDLLPHWDPWWMFRKEEKMIEDVNSFSNVEEDALKQCPSLKEVPKLSDLTKVQPSPTIKFNILNVLASYAFVIRYFNGETEPVEGIICLLNICGNLDANNNYEDPAMAVEAVVQKCLQCELIQTDKLSLDVMKHDTYLIIQGPSKDNKQHYVLAALSHLLTLLTDAKNMKKIKPKKTKTEFNKKFPDHGEAHLSNLDTSKVKKSIKKVEYYLSYVKSYGMDIE